MKVSETQKQGVNSNLKFNPNLQQLPFWSLFVDLWIYAQELELTWAGKFEEILSTEKLTLENGKWLKLAAKATFDKLSPELQISSKKKHEEFQAFDFAEYLKIQRETSRQIVFTRQIPERCFLAASGPWGKLEIERCYG